MRAQEETDMKRNERRDRSSAEIFMVVGSREETAGSTNLVERAIPIAVYG